MKVFWFDTETGGLDRQKSALLTLDGWIEIDGKRVEEIHLKFRPFPNDLVEDGALQTNHLTREEIANFPLPQEGFNKLKAIFRKYVDPFVKKADKKPYHGLCPAGYNVNFDVEVLEAFYKKNGDNFLWATLDYHKLDVMQTAMIFTMAGLIQPQGMKLVNVAEHLEIAMDNAHDSSCDIETTKKIADRFISYLQRARELNGENPKV
jgi:DNA polymerase-3 subunit epsilon